MLIILVKVFKSVMTVRFRGVHSHEDSKGVQHIMIYDRNGKLSVALRVKDGVVQVDKGQVAT